MSRDTHQGGPRPVVLPDIVRAGVRHGRTRLAGETPAALQMVLARIDPRRVVDDAELVAAVLRWTAAADADDPHVARWVDYAAEASQRLHGDEHRLARRAHLARLAVRAGILSGYRQAAPS